MSELAPIGTLHTCFREKFGVPRQPLMIPAATGVLKLKDDPAYRDALRGLESFSHVWIVFLFHKAGERAWRPTVETPRVEAEGKIGVFASRSPHRPNAIGLSAVKLDRIDFEKLEVHVSGVDILDGTPVLDIKPYLPYADSLPDATAGWATQEIEKFKVTFAGDTRKALEENLHPNFAVLVTQMLEWDPRPTSQRKAAPIFAAESEGLRFAFRALDADIHWRIHDRAIEVIEVRSLSS